MRGGSIRSVKEENYDLFCFALDIALAMLAANPPHMITMPIIIITIALPSIIGTPPWIQMTRLCCESMQR